MRRRGWFAALTPGSREARRVVAKRDRFTGDNPGVKFVDLCRSGTRLQGFIQLTTRIGQVEPHREGYHVLRVTKSGGQ